MFEASNRPIIAAKDSAVPVVQKKVTIVEAEPKEKDKEKDQAKEQRMNRALQRIKKKREKDEKKATEEEQNNAKRDTNDVRFKSLKIKNMTEELERQLSKKSTIKEEDLKEEDKKEGSNKEEFIERESGMIDVIQRKSFIPKKKKSQKKIDFGEEE